MKSANLDKFWSRPEGTAGMIVLTALLFGGGVGLYYLLPYAIDLLGMMITAAGLFGVLALLTFLVTDGQMRALVSNGYKLAMRRLTGLMIQIDPIAILKNHIVDMKKKGRTMNEHLAEVRASRESLKRQIGENERETEEYMKLASVARKQGNKTQIRVQTSKAQNLRRENERYSRAFLKAEALYRTLSKLHEGVTAVIEMKEFEVESLEREYKTLKSAHSAMKGAQAVLGGDPDELAVFEQAMHYVNEDMAKKQAQIDHFLETSKQVIDGMDLQKSADLESGLAALDAWEEENDISTILSTPAFDAYKEKAKEDVQKSIGRSQERSGSRSRA